MYYKFAKYQILRIYPCTLLPLVYSRFLKDVTKNDKMRSKEKINSKIFFMESLAIYMYVHIFSRN